MRRSAIGIAILMLAFHVAGRADDVGSTLKSADVALTDRNYDRARMLYERAQQEGAQLQNDLPHARILAVVYLNSNPPDIQKAIEWTKIALKLDPQADGTREQLCKLLLRTGDYGGAVTQYRELVQTHPESADYVSGLADALRQDGRNDEALRLLREKVDRFPTLTSMRVEYARALNFARQFSEARKQFSAVLAIDPNDLIAQVGLAKSMSYQGDQESALQAYEDILRRHPGLYDAQIGKAFALLWSGRTEEAKSLLQAGLKRHPDDREVREALAAMPGGGGVAVAQAAAPHVMQPPAPAHVAPAVTPAAAKATKIHVDKSAADSKPVEAAKKTAPASAAIVPAPRDSEWQPGWWTLLGASLLLLAAAVALLWKLPTESRVPAAPSEPEFPEPKIEQEVSSHYVPSLMVDAGESAVLKHDTVAELVAVAKPVMDSRATETPVTAETSREIESELILEAKRAAAKAAESASELPLYTDLDDVPIEVGEQRAAVEAAESKVVPIDAPRMIEVMIVGGLDSVVRLQCRWLKAQFPEVRPVLEPHWAAAVRAMDSHTPALIVLNASSGDRWTSLRMMEWIHEERPEYRGRTVAVTSADQPIDRWEEFCILEPIDMKEWQQKLSAALMQYELRANVAGQWARGAAAGARQSLDLGR